MMRARRASDTAQKIRARKRYPFATRIHIAATQRCLPLPTPACHCTVRESILELFSEQLVDNGHVPAPIFLIQCHAPATGIPTVLVPGRMPSTVSI